MPKPDELIVIFDRILTGNYSQEDAATLRQWLRVSSLQFVSQDGKFNTIIGQVQGGDIHIGARHYQGTDAESIRAILQEVLSPQTCPIEIDWHNISRVIMKEQLELDLTTNILTRDGGITYSTKQVYVPLGLVERKKQTRRGEDVLPDQGSALYEEIEITKCFEHKQFLDQVLGQGKSPKSWGKRIAIIGEPGAGKTTLLQQIAQWVTQQIEGAIAIWVSLADLRGQELEPYLLERWLQKVARQLGQAEASGRVQDAFVSQFQQKRVWLLLDGADEMQVSSGNPLGEISRQLRMGGLLSQARIVLTSRLNLWDSNRNALHTFDTYRTLEFCYPQQVEQFIGQWFSLIPEPQIEQGRRLCAALKAPGKGRIRDLVKNPLRLSLLCFNWYLREGKLPETKTELYHQFVEDFYDWKREQFHTKPEQSRQLNTKLGELAREAIDRESIRFRLRHDFVCEFLGTPDEPESFFQLALELGWLNKVGVDVENPRKPVYAFLHPTFQEYFAALAIDDWHFLLNHFPKNPAHPDASYRIFEPYWKEVFLLWIGQKNINENQKKSLIEALVDFDDMCENFYGYRAYFLASVGITEFKKSNKADEIINKVIQLTLEESSVISQEAKIALLETDRERVVNAFSCLLDNVVLPQVKRKVAMELGRVEPGHPKAVATLSSLLDENDLHYFERSDLAQDLGEVDPGNPKAIAALIQMLYIEQDEDWWTCNGRGEVGDGSQVDFAFSIMFAAAGLERIGNDNKQVIKALLDVLTKSKILDINYRVIQSLGKLDLSLALMILNPALAQSKSEQDDLRISEVLGKIDPDSWKVIRVLLRLLLSEDEDIRIEALRSLGEVGRNMPEAVACHKAIATVISLFESEKWKYFHNEIALCLGKIGNGPVVIKTLASLLKDSQDELTRFQAAVALKQVDSEHEEATNFLIDLIFSYKNQNFSGELQMVVESLKQTRQSAKLAKIVTNLHKLIDSNSGRENSEIYAVCFEIIWYCAQKLSYPVFYRAWNY
ncbi:NACHT domain-containing protein [Scytonema sp. UIC 10036]|uniref:HEAT repeat domain-containing protein n=1 Tax=Scytonema sp. UIC 10036 TaxID=2304196 RepID=UPI0012DA5090|nr:HEAT repeat domain-containing protein [Scytonema sp. UIC 10036]MUG94449.1 NACHT domain-containing protein [Scytonema sp. UIC 10036]